jgi:hypothetical protein
MGDSVPLELEFDGMTYKVPRQRLSAFLSDQSDLTRYTVQTGASLGVFNAFLDWLEGGSRPAATATSAAMLCALASEFRAPELGPPWDNDEDEYDDSPVPVPEGIALRLSFPEPE